MKRYEDALGDFTQAIELAPTYIWAIAHRGETYRCIKCYKMALADFNRVIDLDPNNVWAIAHRGATYFQLRRLEQALLDLNRAINLKPDYAWAIIYRGQVYASMKQYEKALVDGDRAITLDETIIAHWRGERGLLLNYLGRYAETIADCEPALQEKSGDYIASYSLAVAKTCLEGLAQAQANIDATRTILRSVMDAEADGLVVYRLGGLAALEGKTIQALNHLQKAISLDDEPAELARHDPAWLSLRLDARFQSLIAEATETWQLDASLPDI